MQFNIEDQYNSRRLLYENKDIFYNFLDETQETEENAELAEISNTIIKGQKLLTSNIIDYNTNLTKVKQIDDVIKSAGHLVFETQQRLDHLQHSVSNVDIPVDDLQNTIDGISYSMNYVLENIETQAQVKKEELQASLNKNQQTIKSLSKAYNVLRNANISYTCPVCMHNQVDVYLDTCGHTYCTTCISKAKYCYLCRAKFNKINSLYFSV